MKYPHEQVEDVSLLQCWDSLVQKQFINNNDHLKNELTLLEDKELVQEGIMSGTPSKEAKPQWFDKYEELEIPPDVKK
ncbi:hypothetical protein A2U01_0067529 [Trifolium medium]|uniref:Uncharacterized protein n=1 Tax=Trifolium medium TaxID=97028 RepID=A0A392SC96_9FABA|nr:hypothetical protein [Trifolium medium]